MYTNAAHTQTHTCAHSPHTDTRDNHRNTCTQKGKTYTYTLLSSLIDGILSPPVPLFSPLDGTASPGIAKFQGLQYHLITKIEWMGSCIASCREIPFFFFFFFTHLSTGRSEFSYRTAPLDLLEILCLAQGHFSLNHLAQGKPHHNSSNTFFPPHFKNTLKY